MPTNLRLARACSAGATLMVATMLAACAGDSGGDGGGEGTQAAGGDACSGEEVAVGTTNSASDAPLYIAQDKGYFEDEGLSVTLQPFNSAAQMIAPLGAGDLQVGAGAPSAGFYNAVASGVELRIVADKGSMPENYGYMPLMVRKDLFDSGEVTEIADLEGRTVAEPAQGTATSSTLGTMLDSAGLTYDDVQHEYIGFSEHATAFDNGAIDASLTTEPNATVAEQRGVAVRMATPPEFYDNQQLAVLLYSGAFADESAEVGHCFMRAYMQAARDYVDAFQDGELTGEAGDEIAEIVTGATGLDPELYREIVPNYVDPSGAVNMDSLQKDYEFLSEQGLIDGEVAVEDIVDSSFAEAAVEDLGEYSPGDD
ncbi:NitT/TauT family transport system substrate-binding protein [Blastococcus colisei]|uniref:NitT/TauT family transport system substrate-binding protein n=1 Tax=Blastococcus colisei TaxID=1564162 RepID=A0A543PID2_9ACTN|nr:ABC transporter substrate-binding protein [Blastococcus colisei]TQN43814.1 NitT/TauT family transport system substrate-binding protein [Blastococcus colisei]